MLPQANYEAKLDTNRDGKEMGMNRRNMPLRGPTRTEATFLLDANRGHIAFGLYLLWFTGQEYQGRATQCKDWSHVQQEGELKNVAERWQDGGLKNVAVSFAVTPRLS